MPRGHVTDSRLQLAMLHLRTVMLLPERSDKECLMKIIDCRNMACPVPVVTTKRALEEAAGEPVQVLVDPGAPRENVTRFAANRGYRVDEAVTDNGFALTISPGDATLGSSGTTGQGGPALPSC